MGGLLDWMVRSGWRRGVFGGNQIWLVAGLAAFLVRRVRNQREPRTVYLEELASGEAITITHHPVPG